MKKSKHEEFIDGLKKWVDEQELTPQERAFALWAIHAKCIWKYSDRKEAILILKGSRNAT